MRELLANLNMSRAFVLGVALSWFGLSLGVLPAGADGGAKKNVAPSSPQTDNLSTDNLQKQIGDLDVQIQKLKEQSLELQEKTRAKLQMQLEGLKQQRDTLLPRIEKLRDTSETAWQDIKENIQKTIEDLKASVDSMEK